MMLLARTVKGWKPLFIYYCVMEFHLRFGRVLEFNFNNQITVATFLHSVSFLPNCTRK